MIDYHDLLSEEIYPYLSDEERTFILDTFLLKRISMDSKKNILYILGSFSNHLKMPLFEISQRNVPGYLDHMNQKVVKKEWKKEYAACIFSELSRFYDFAVTRGKMESSPFGTFTPPYTAIKSIDPAKLPTYEAVDNLFSDLSGQPELYLAAALAFRMALPLREIVGLKKNQVCVQRGEQDLYLRVKRGHKEDAPDQFLYIPSDLYPLLDEVGALHPACPYFFYSTHGGGSITRSGLQHRLQRSQRDPSHAISLSDLRSLSIYLMMVCQVPVPEIAEFTGVKGAWLVRYDHIAPELRLEASRFVNLRLEPRIRS